MVERRRAARRTPGTTDPLSRARLRTGPALVVSDISDLGAAVRTGARLLPGTHVEVHLVTTGGRVLRRARVARAAVWSIDGTGVVYQVALSFDAPVDSSARRVTATREEDLPGPSDGDRLPTRADPGTGGVAAAPPLQSPRFAAMAPDLEKGTGCTFVKESRDVDH